VNAQHVFDALTLRGLMLAHPRALYWLVPVALLAGWSVWRAGAPRRAAAPSIRTLALALLVLALADPQSVIRSEGNTRPVLIDASASITPAMRVFTLKLLRDGLGFRQHDPAIVFGTVPVDQTFGATEDNVAGGFACSACAPGATNLEAALDRIAADPAAHNGPVVLVTDGWQNRGEAGAAINALRAAGIRLFIFTPPGAQAIPNITMTELSLPPALAKAEPFALGVTMANLNAQSAAGTLSIYRNGVLIEQRAVTLAPGESRYDFPVRSAEAGLVAYRAVFKPANPALDADTGDDSLQGWVGIGAQRKVLILTDSARDASYLETVVRRAGFQPSTAVLAGGEYNGNPKGYDAVILNNVARSRVTPAAQSALVEYVASGGSLAMTGGDQSFGLGGYESSPIAKVMPVVMKPPQRHERRRALVLIIDKSGSMGRNDKLVYAKAAAMTVTKTMSDADLVGVIGFDSQPFVVVPLGPLGKTRPYFQELIGRLKARGTTFLLPALEEAERTLAQSGAAIKHVVILTDGETGGTASMYYDLVSNMHREGGATISAIAIGREANLPLLEAIARYGGGGFYQTDSPSNLPELFLEDVNQRGGDTTMVEKNFVPYTVSSDPILKDLAGRRLPALKGFVATDLKPGASLSIFVDDKGNRSPIVASWKFGTGKALAMTTDASGRWSSLWVQDGVFGQVWDRLIAWMTPQTAAAQKFDVALGYRAGRIEVRLTDYSEGAGTASRPLDARVTGPDGTKYDAILTQDGPGELAGSIEATRPGTYNIEIRPARGQAEGFPPLAYTVSPAVEAETPRPAPNYGLLEHLASATGGRLNPSPGELALSRPQFERTASMSGYLVFAAMLLLIGEALVRRLTF
jgi:Ca-activated chloride channel homolog